MYAVIQTGGKQYKVCKGDVIEVESLGASEKDKEIIIKDILLVSDGKDIKIGNPLVKNAGVVCELIGDFKGPKVISFKYRRRKNSRWKKGHRQLLSRLKVKEIKA